jgi:hypothetical protein
MNDNDHQNIQFILSRSPTELTKWVESMKEVCDQEEFDYVMEMLLQAKNHIEMQLLEFWDTEDDVSEAADYLKKFQLQ